MCRMCSGWMTTVTAWMNEMEGASTALVLTWTADSAGPILCGNPLHRPVTTWAEASALSKSHQKAQAGPSLLQLSGSAFDTHGYELAEIPCCHLVFSTAKHQPNEQRFFQLSFRSQGLQQHHWRLGQSRETRHLPACVTAVWLSQLSQAGACWTVWWLSVKHIQPFQTFTGESIYCLYLAVYLPCFALGDHGHGINSRRTPKHHLHLPGPSQPKTLLLAPGRVRSVQGRLWSKKMAWTKEKELQTTTATWSSDGALHLQTASWECGSFSRTGKPARELLEQCPTDLSSGINFHVKKRTWLWVSLVRI